MNSDNDTNVINLAEKSRERRLERIKSGEYTFTVVNIGDPTKDISLNTTNLMEICDELGFTADKNKKIKITFDNRSFSSRLRDALYELGKPDLFNSDELPTVFPVILQVMKLGGWVASAIKKDNEVLILTQDLAFFSALKQTSLEKVIRHELKHLTQEPLQAPTTTQNKLSRNPIAMTFLNLSMGMAPFVGLVTNWKLKEFVSNLSTIDPDLKVLMNGIFIPAIGVTISVLPILAYLKIYLEYFNDPKEKEANDAEKVLLEKQIASHSPTTATEDFAIKILRALRKDRNSSSVY